MKSSKLKTIKEREAVLTDSTRETKYHDLISEIEGMELGETIVRKNVKNIDVEKHNITNALYRRKDTLKTPKGHRIKVCISQTRKDILIYWVPV